MSSNPVVSVIVPTYRRPEKLERALASIPEAMSQSGEHNHQTIVVDDCPEGSAFAVARRFNAQYVHKAGRDRGLSSSRNIGMSLARGQYLCFLDDDDFFLPQGLQRLLVAAQIDGVAVVFGDYQAFNTEMKADVPLAGVTIDNLLVCNQIPVGSYVLNRGMVCRNFDVNMRSHEDWDFLLSHVTQGGFRYTSGAVVVIDKTENYTTSNQARRRRLFWLDFLSVYSRFPARHLSSQRTQMLASLGIQIPENLLQFDDEI